MAVVGAVVVAQGTRLTHLGRHERALCDRGGDAGDLDDRRACN